MTASSVIPTTGAPFHVIPTVVASTLGEATERRDLSGSVPPFSFVVRRPTPSPFVLRAKREERELRTRSVSKDERTLAQALRPPTPSAGTPHAR